MSENAANLNQLSKIIEAIEEILGDEVDYRVANSRVFIEFNFPTNREVVR